jgi:hypothetical protein
MPGGFTLELIQAGVAGRSMGDPHYMGRMRAMTFAWQRITAQIVSAEVAFGACKPIRWA